MIFRFGKAENATGKIQRKVGITTASQQYLIIGLQQQHSFLNRVLSFKWRIPFLHFNSYLSSICNELTSLLYPRMTLTEPSSDTPNRACKQASPATHEVVGSSSFQVLGTHEPVLDLNLNASLRDLRETPTTLTNWPNW